MASYTRKGEKEAPNTSTGVAQVLVQLQRDMSNPESEIAKFSELFRQQKSIEHQQRIIISEAIANSRTTDPRLRTLHSGATKSNDLSEQLLGARDELVAHIRGILSDETVTRFINHNKPRATHSPQVIREYRDNLIKDFMQKLEKSIDEKEEVKALVQSADWERIKQTDAYRDFSQAVISKFKEARAEGQPVRPSPVVSDSGLASPLYFEITSMRALKEDNHGTALNLMHQAADDIIARQEQIAPSLGARNR